MKKKFLLGIVASTFVAAFAFNQSFKSTNSSDLELKYLLAEDIAAYTHESSPFVGDSCSYRDTPHHYTLHFQKRNRKWNFSISWTSSKGGGSNDGGGGDNSGGSYCTQTHECYQRECLGWPRTMPGKYCTNDCPQKCSEEAAANATVWIDSHNGIK